MTQLMVLPGDGIGPEIVAAARDVLDAADRRFGLGLTYVEEAVGFESLHRWGTTLRDEVLERSRAADGIILGTQSHADYPAPEKGGRNVSAGYRIGLDLYANVRPARSRIVPNQRCVVVSRSGPTRRSTHFDHSRFSP